MEVEKVTMNIKVEVLHTDCIPALLNDLAEEIITENLRGTLIKEDGDTITWDFTRVKKVI